MKTENATLLGLLDELRRSVIQYRLSQHRADAIMVEVAVPGERWEVEFLQDGSVEVDRFKSDGTIADASSLAEMVARNSDAVR